MAEGMIKQAIANMSSKHIPSSAPANSVFVPQEQYRRIFPLLDVWGSDTESTKVQEKVKFIFGNLSADNPDDSLISVLIELGGMHPGETKLDKVYKYFNLRRESMKMIGYHNAIARKINEGRAETDVKTLSSKALNALKYREVLLKEMGALKVNTKKEKSR